MKWLTAFFAALLLAAGPASAGERIAVAPLGVALTAPDGWERITAAEASAHLADVRFSRSDFQQQASRAGRPVISIRRVIAPGYVGPVPMLNLLFLPLIVDRTPLEVMQRTVRVAGEALGQIEVLDAPHEVRISGLPAAHARIAYTVQQGGVSSRGISEYWVVIRGRYVFAFSSGYGRDEPPATRAAIQAVIDSARIDPDH